jgi:hypothetical protein
MEKVEVYTSFYSFCKDYKSKLDCGYIEEFLEFLKKNADVDIYRTIKYLILYNDENKLNKLKNDSNHFIKWSINKKLNSNKIRNEIMNKTGHKSNTYWHGIYTIHGVKNNCIELIYVGMSGKDGKQKQDVFGRICNTRSGGKSATKTYKGYLEVEGYDYLIFNFLVYDSNHLNSLKEEDITPKFITPKFMESAFISFYFCRTKEFPKYNKDLLG